MSHISAFIAGMLLGWFVVHGRTDVKNSLTCPDISIEKSSELSDAFIACRKSLDDKIDKLFSCQEKTNLCEIKKQGLENRSCDSAKSSYNE